MGRVLQASAARQAHYQPCLQPWTLSGRVGAFSSHLKKPIYSDTQLLQAPACPPAQPDSACVQPQQCNTVPAAALQQTASAQIVASARAAAGAAAEASFVRTRALLARSAAKSDPAANADSSLSAVLRDALWEGEPGSPAGQQLARSAATLSAGKPTLPSAAPERITPQKQPGDSVAGASGLSKPPPLLWMPEGPEAAKLGSMPTHLLTRSGTRTTLGEAFSRQHTPSPVKQPRMDSWQSASLGQQVAAQEPAQSVSASTLKQHKQQHDQGKAASMNKQQRAAHAPKTEDVSSLGGLFAAWSQFCEPSAGGKAGASVPDGLPIPTASEQVTAASYLPAHVCCKRLASARLLVSSLRQVMINSGTCEPIT